MSGLENVASKLGDLPAHPAPDIVDYYTTGMTYRQWLVGMALQGLLASDHKRETHYDAIASDAVKHADAVLAELERLS